jgi:hypothetical protein
MTSMLRYHSGTDVSAIAKKRKLLAADDLRIPVLRVNTLNDNKVIVRINRLLDRLEARIVVAPEGLAPSCIEDFTLNCQ